MLLFENEFERWAFHRMLHFAWNRRENFKSKLIAIEDLSRINWITMSALCVWEHVLWEYAATYIRTHPIPIRVFLLFTWIYQSFIERCVSLCLCVCDSNRDSWLGLSVNERKRSHDICVMRYSLCLYVWLVGNGLLFKSIWSIWVFVRARVRCVTKCYLKHYQQTC